MGGIRTRLFATHVCMVTCPKSSVIFMTPSAHGQRSPTASDKSEARGFGYGLSPENLRRGITRPVSYYAFFK